MSSFISRAKREIHQSGKAGICVVNEIGCADVRVLSSQKRETNPNGSQRKETFNISPLQNNQPAQRTSNHQVHQVHQDQDQDHQDYQDPPITIIGYVDGHQFQKKRTDMFSTLSRMHKLGMCKRKSASDKNIYKRHILISPF